MIFLHKFASEHGSQPTMVRLIEAIMTNPANEFEW